MFERLLIPLDGSPEGEAVLSEVPRVAATGAEVYLLHVIPNVTPPVGSPTVGLFTLPEHAEQYLDGLAVRLSNVRTRTFVDAGDPADRILKVALSLNIDTIAMTTHARAGISRSLLGSVAQEVVRRSSLPVFLVRPGMPTRARPVRRILVPLDGSPRSERMLDVLRPLAYGTRAELLLLHVVPLEEDTALRDPSRAYEKMARSLESACVSARPIVTRGDPVIEIIHQAKAQDVDAIAMATHGRTGLERMLVGSVAEGVLRRADCPVLLLRVVGVPKLQETERTAP
jgi:nucleotide-binding universal stress UspA family protein